MPAAFAKASALMMFNPQAARVPVTEANRKGLSAVTMVEFKMMLAGLEVHRHGLAHQAARHLKVPGNRRGRLRL